MKSSFGPKKPEKFDNFCPERASAKIIKKMYFGPNDDFIKTF